MVTNILKKTLLVLLIVAGLLILDLYTLELIVQDPGYYVVARRSDHPRQVLDALDRLNLNRVTVKKLTVLVNRYKQKSSGTNQSPDQRQLWEKAEENTLKLLRKKK